MTREHDPSLRRILAAVDASPLSLAGLRLAARLARRLGAELTALYVEDVNLVRAAAYPRAYVYSLLTATQRPLEASVIEQAFRFQATLARRALDDAMAAFELAASLETRRGAVAREMLAAAQEADLLVLGWSGRHGPAGEIGSTARAVLARAGGPVLLLRREPPAEAGVVAVVEPGAAGRAAMALAARLAAREAPLDVVVLAAEPEGGDAAAMLGEARARAGAHPGGGEAMALPMAPAEALSRLLAARPGWLVVTTPDLRHRLDGEGHALLIARQAE